MINSIGSENPSRDGKGINLPAEITRAASKQTYYTIRFLVDHERVQDAYRAYAYFRWVDDQLDTNIGTQPEKLAFVNRQQDLLEACYRDKIPALVSREEQILVDLIRNDHEKASELQIYLRNMMAVMSFDVQRKGRVISRAELTEYSRLLSTAIAEALRYFIGHDEKHHSNPARYQAIYGAHIAHMLRDMMEDLELGYINIPAESLQAAQISLDDPHSVAFRMWVLEQVKQARQCFNAGRKYIAQIKNTRRRLAEFTYLARFEWMIQAIERDGYCLRREYPDRKSLRAVLWMLWRVFLSMLNISIQKEPDSQVILPECIEER